MSTPQNLSHLHWMVGSCPWEVHLVFTTLKKFFTSRCASNVYYNYQQGRSLRGGWEGEGRDTFSGHAGWQSPRGNEMGSKMNNLQ
jgi:hypothetical protein